MEDGWIVNKNFFTSHFTRHTRLFGKTTALSYDGNEGARARARDKTHTPTWMSTQPNAMQVPQQYPIQS